MFYRWRLYALALLRGAAKAHGARPMPPELAGLLEKLYSEVQDRAVMIGIDIEGQFDGADTKH